MLRALCLRRAVAASRLSRGLTTHVASSAAARAAFARSTRAPALQNSRRSTSTVFQHNFSSSAASSVSPAATETPSSPQLTEQQRESVVAGLKARCNELFDDNEAYVLPSEALDRWLDHMQTLHSQYDAAQLSEDVALAYESGVAIASKQGQFQLAAELTQQMQTLGYLTSARTYQFLVRNVALQLRAGSKHTSVDDLRELLKDVSDDKWEREIMSVVEREERPLQLKTEKEFARFHQKLIAGVEAQLDAYERSLGAADSKQLKLQRSTVPYNEALRVYADNGVKFSRMLELMVARDLAVDVETYEALLLGARWNEIPATLSQLLDSSKLVHELTAAASSTGSEHVHRLWVNAMKAVVYSSTERFSSLSAIVYKRDIQQLRKVFEFVDQQLSRAFPKFQFATPEQCDQVYEMRVKAAAACGLIGPVKRILDEYATRAPARVEGEKPALSKEPFLAALEIFSWSLMDVLMLTRDDALARAESRTVATSPHVLELRQMFERVMRKLTQAQASIEEIKAKMDAEGAKLDEDELRELLSQQNLANMMVEEESRRATTLERRLDNARVIKANQVLIKECLSRGDMTVDYVMSKFLDAGFDVENDLDVSVKLMEEYRKAAQRLEKRLAQRQRHVSPHMMHRVFGLANSVTKTVESGGLSLEDPENRDKLAKFFEHAVCAAVRFWRDEETDALVRQQQRLLGTPQLAPREYDVLIFQRVTNLDVRGAHSLLQEMHNAGMKPSQEAIHRIALCLLHQRNHSPNGLYSGAAEDDAETAEAGEEGDEEESAAAAGEEELAALLNTSDRDAIEKELDESLTLDGDEKVSADSAAATRSLLLGSDAPATIEDLIGFLQDWYNLYGVEPMGKTVVPMFARLLDANKIPEFCRLLQILEAMEGGLTPSTQLWLEKRLDRLGGKTLGDFRLQ